MEPAKSGMLVQGVGKIKARKNSTAVVFNIIVDAASDQFFQTAIKELQLGSCSVFVRFSVNLKMGGIGPQSSFDRSENAYVRIFCVCMCVCMKLA